MDPAHTYKQNSLMIDKIDGINILVADDEDSGFRIFERILNEEGINTIRAVNGREAVDLALSKNDIQIIIMDIKMPVLNGIEASRIIHKSKPQLPIIATSAFAMPGDRRLFIEAGCIDYIPKPIKADVLLSMVKNYILQR